MSARLPPPPPALTALSPPLPLPPLPLPQNLALNIAEKGFPISVYNRSGDKTDAAVARAVKEGVGERLHGYKDLKDFVASLERPRWGCRGLGGLGCVVGWAAWPARVQESKGGPARGGQRRRRPGLPPGFLAAAAQCCSPRAWACRRVIILVKAGAPVDATVAQLSELLEPGDIIVDGGNEW